MEKSSGDAENKNVREIKEIFSQNIKEESCSVLSIKLPDSLKIKFNRVQTIFSSENPSNVQATDFFLLTSNCMMLTVGFLILGVTIAVVRSCYSLATLSNDSRVPLAITATFVSGIMVLTSTWFSTFCISAMDSMRFQLGNVLCAIKFLMVTVCCLIAGLYLTSLVRAQIVLSRQNDTQHSGHSKLPPQEIVQVYDTYYHMPTDWNNVGLKLDVESIYYNVTKFKLKKFMALYNSSRHVAHYWDNVQHQYSCCGIDSALDWKQEGNSIPQSCCIYYDNVRNTTIQCPYYHTTGCLDRIGFVIAWYASLLFGVTVITLVISVNAFTLLLYIYVDKRRNQH